MCCVFSVCQSANGDCYQSVMFGLYLHCLVLLWIDGGLGKRIYGLDNSHSPDKKPPNDHEHKTVWPKSPPGARPRESIGRRVDELSLSKAFDLFPKRVDEILKKLNLPVEVVGQKRTADAKVELRNVRSAKKS